MGHSVREEIRAARIAESKRLTADLTYPLSAIPKRCGYTSDGTFLRIFKETTGRTLGSCRKR